HQPNEAAAASPAPSASLLVTRDFRCIPEAWEDVEPCEQPLHGGGRGGLACQGL
ncbi:unnamed protein product, partial [Ectocarpus sp. 12 AP-2014]